MLALFVLIAVLFSPPQVKPDCREIERITGGVELEWLGYEQGGWDLPDDLKRSATIHFAEGGIWEFKAESEPGTRYIWWFSDFVADGDPVGYHNFCALRLTDD